jgi:hypothetical protein
LAPLEGETMRQMKGGSFSISPGRQSFHNRKARRMPETRFKPGRPWPVQAMMKGQTEVVERQA